MLNHVFFLSSLVVDFLLYIYSECSELLTRITRFLITIFVVDVEKKSVRKLYSYIFYVSVYFCVLIQKPDHL